MARKPSGRPDGRPPVAIDQKQFEALCRINPTVFETCSVFHCDEDTINRWCKKTYGETFAVVSGRLAGEGRTSLRRQIWQKAFDDKDKDQWKAIDKLADKHLGMGSNQNQALTVHQSPDKELKVTWQSVTQDDAKDFMDK